MDSFTSLLRALNDRAVRYVVIGVWGANYYALGGSTLFTTRDRDLFLPSDPDNLTHIWAACEAVGLSLWMDDEPLDSPRDRWLAERLVASQALVRATDAQGLEVDLSLIMAGFVFDDVWPARRLFSVEGVEVPVARLTHIVRSKAVLGRPKDQLFLATHAAALKQLLRRDSEELKG